MGKFKPEPGRCSFNSLETKNADVTAALEYYLAHNPDVTMGSAGLLRNQLHSISTIIMLVGGFISAIFAMACLHHEDSARRPEDARYFMTS